MKWTTLRWESFRPLAGKWFLKAALATVTVLLIRFPSPCGEVVSKSLELEWERLTITQFPSPCGEVVSKRILNICKGVEASRFPSPCGEVVSKRLRNFEDFLF